eukprot:UN4345
MACCNVAYPGGVGLVRHGHTTEGIHERGPHEERANVRSQLPAVLAVLHALALAHAPEVREAALVDDAQVPEGTPSDGYHLGQPPREIRLGVRPIAAVCPLRLCPRLHRTRVAGKLHLYHCRLVAAVDRGEAAWDGVHARVLECLGARRPADPRLLAEEGNGGLNAAIEEGQAGTTHDSVWNLRS